MQKRKFGKALKGHRDQVTLATKFGSVRSPEGKLPGVNGRPEYVKTSCEGSLRRLGADTIDLYYLHRVDTGTPIAETIGAMAELVCEGKVCYLGISEAAPATLLGRVAAVHQLPHSGQNIPSGAAMWRTRSFPSAASLELVLCHTARLAVDF